MRYGSADLDAALRGPNVSWRMRCESWYGGERLSADVGVAGGSITWTDGRLRRSQGQLSVPVGDEFRTEKHRHPVAPYGQKLRPIVDVETPAGRVESVPLGWHFINTAPVIDGVADVELRDLTRLIERARAVTPQQLGHFSGIVPAWTWKKTLAVALAGILPVAVLNNFGTVAKPTYIMRDRLKWLEDDVLPALAAWAWVDDSGALCTGTSAWRNVPPSQKFSNDDEGTVVTITPPAGPGFNACVGEGRAPDGAPIYAGAYIKDGPMAWPVGPDTTGSLYGANPGFLYSELMTTSDMVREACETQLAAWSEGSGGGFTIDAAPDPRTEAGDVVELEVDGDEPVLGRVSSVSLPMTADGGTMQIVGDLL